ncbi:MAG TPA: SDR family NAD(P)-dependent oxidoreductase [Beijerinckiaceae bacterium]|nr:SDR family NAD(P)-dependent oxidoreductase [Beijerinckiaceae bacterium]
MAGLEGKVAWITGGGGGIGRATAIALAQEGAALALTGRRTEALQETAGLLVDGANVLIEPADVNDASSIQGIAERIERKFGALDIVVNNAGVNISERRWADLTPGGVKQLIGANLIGAFNCVIAALPVMRRRRGGLFIHIGSRAARYWDGPGGAGYIAAKSGLAAMSHTINVEEAANGVRSTLINPGETATPLLLSRTPPPSADDLQKILRPEDCADLIRYIACLPDRIRINEITLTPIPRHAVAAGK